MIHWKSGTTIKHNRKNKKLYDTINWLIKLNNSNQSIHDFLLTNPIPDERLQIELTNHRGNIIKNREQTIKG
jgi:hypothetical protein